MVSANNWLQALRLRTLPLSASVIIAGAALVYSPFFFSWKIFILTLLTACCLQVLSNLANDYGDFKAGTDNKERIGPARTMQQGLIGVAEMKKALVVLVLLCLGSGIWLLLEVFDKNEFKMIFIFLSVGLVCIVAAIKYTVGKSAYGYRALGDVAVLLFFGGVGVIGSSYLHIRTFIPEFIWVAACFGMLSAAVLNLNNMRDVENDKASRKNTLVVKIGFNAAKKYHAFLITGAVTCMLVFAFVSGSDWKNWIFVAVFPLFFVDLIKIWKLPSEQLDPFLKKTAIFTFLLSVLFFISRLISV
jgi:1,4-dihydroxy-2-naphthoate octaprenyltransferase